MNSFLAILIILGFLITVGLLHAVGTGIYYWVVIKIAGPEVKKLLDRK